MLADGLLHILLLLNAFYIWFINKCVYIYIHFSGDATKRWNKKELPRKTIVCYSFVVVLLFVCMLQNQNIGFLGSPFQHSVNPFRNSI